MRAHLDFLHLCFHRWLLEGREKSLSPGRTIDSIPIRFGLVIRRAPMKRQVLGRIPTIGRSWRACAIQVSRHGERQYALAQMKTLPIVIRVLLSMAAAQWSLHGIPSR
jgi:hypothetical protein